LAETPDHLICGGPSGTLYLSDLSVDHPQPKATQTLFTTARTLRGRPADAAHRREEYPFSVTNACPGTWGVVISRFSVILHSSTSGVPSFSARTRISLQATSNPCASLYGPRTRPIRLPKDSKSRGLLRPVLQGKLVTSANLVVTNPLREPALRLWFIPGLLLGKHRHRILSLGQLPCLRSRGPLGYLDSQRVWLRRFLIGNLVNHAFIVVPSVMPSGGLLDVPDLPSHGGGMLPCEKLPPAWRERNVWASGE